MRMICSALTTVALILPAVPAVAAPDDILGSWSGSGTARPADGAPEKVSCRLSYSEGSGRTYEISATCSHTGGSFTQSGRVVSVGGNRYTGRMYSSQYNATGDVAVTLNGNRQTVYVKSEKGSASVSLRKR